MRDACDPCTSSETQGVMIRTAAIDLEGRRQRLIGGVQDDPVRVLDWFELVSARSPGRSWRRRELG